MYYINARATTNVTLGFHLATASQVQNVRLVLGTKLLFNTLQDENRTSNLSQICFSNLYKHGTFLIFDNYFHYYYCNNNTAKYTNMSAKSFVLEIENSKFLCILMLISTILLNNNSLSAQCYTNPCGNTPVFTDSFTGTLGQSTVPPGWVIVSGSPDINQGQTAINTTPGYSWCIPDIDVPYSSNGGTFVSGCCGSERMKRDITGLSPSTTYTICIEQMATCIVNNSFVYDGLGGNAAILSGHVVGGSITRNFPMLDSLWNWECGCIEFTTINIAAPVVSIELVSTDPDAYSAFDGLEIYEACPTCLTTATMTTTNLTCNGDANGGATVTAANGTLPYTYSWSNGSNSQTINGLTAGTYTVTITDAAGCELIEQAVISEPSALQIAVSGASIPCNSGGGFASATATGGIPGYTYLWSANAGGQTSPMVSGLSAGTYLVTATDASQCQVIGSITIASNEPIILDISSTDVSCFGENDGVAIASTTGGTAPIQYTWSNGNALMTASSLDAGTYSLTVSDAAGCTTTGTVTIDEPDYLSVIFNTVDVGCDSIDDGAAIAVNDGGVPPYSYEWDSGHNGSTASNLSVGIYKVTLTDASGCFIRAGVTVGQEDCQPFCPINPCVEAIVNNTDICTAITTDPNDPLSTLDCDNDGVTNADECLDMTDPLDPCDYVDTSITLPVTADQSECPVPCPDLTPVMTILPGNIAGQSAVEVAVQVTELDDVDSNGSIVTVRVPSDPRLVFVWNIGLTVAALIPVQNAKWNYLGDNGFMHTWTYNGPGLIIPAKSVAAFGFQAFYDPQSTDGQTTLTATILPFSGGECNPLNNTDSERLVYFE